MMDYIKIFKDKYVNTVLLEKNILLWNSLNVELNKISKIELLYFLENFKKNIVFYNERTKIVEKLKNIDIIKMIENKKYWNDIDFIIFNAEINWFIAYTHEDIILSYGIKK